MIMADVFKILFLILGMLICTVSHWLLFAALFPRAVGKMQFAIQTHPYRVFMTGALVGVPLTLLSLALASQGAGPLKMLGVACLLSITAAALFGSTALVRQVGLGLYNGQQATHNGGLVLRGGAVVSIACVFPGVGWFLLIPLVLIAGFGAAVQLRPARATVPAATPVTPGAAQA